MHLFINHNFFWVARKSSKFRHFNIYWSEELWWCQEKLMSKSIWNLCVYTLCRTFMHYDTLFMIRQLFSRTLNINLYFIWLIFPFKEIHWLFFVLHIARILLLCCGGSLVEKINFYIFYSRPLRFFWGEENSVIKHQCRSKKSLNWMFRYSKWQGEAQKSHKELLLYVFFTLSTCTLALSTQRA